MSASPAQIDLIEKLLAERVVSPEHKAKIYEICKRPDAAAYRGGPISQLIDGLMMLPKKGVRLAPAPAANAEPGYYLLADGSAVVVVENKAKTRTYGKRFTPSPDGGRPSWVYERGLGISVAELTPMTGEDAARIGLSHGYCVKCCAELGGESLSAAVSALIGYGETCARNQGWPYPKGAAAQREFIAEHGGL